MAAVPNMREVMRIYNLKHTNAEDVQYAKAIRQALKQTDEREAAINAFRTANSWPKTLRFSHGTSWENAQSILANGFTPSSVGCLGPGVYVGRTDKALRFARNGNRHGGDCGGLVEVSVTIRRPKFVDSDDHSWQAEGYDACRAELTSASQHMEWCVKSPQQCHQIKIARVPLDETIPIGPPLDPPPAMPEQAVPTGGASLGGGHNGAMTLSLFKPSVESKTGIRLAGAQGAPRVVALNPDGLAANEPEPTRLHPGDLILEVNQQPADGHEATTAMIKAATGMVLIDIWRVNTEAATPGRTATNATDSAIAFGMQLSADEVLRVRCKDKPSWIHNFNKWKKREHDEQRLRSGGANQALFFLSHMKTKDRVFHGLPKVQVKSGRVIISMDPTGDGKERAGGAAEDVNEQRERVEADKNGMVVSNVKFEDIIGIGDTAERRVVVTNLSTQTRTMTAKLVMSKVGRDGMNRAPFALRGVVDAVSVRASGQVVFTVCARPTFAGISRDILSINFDGTFTIGRYLEARCGDADLHDLLKPQAPYVKPKRKAPGPPRHLIEVVGAPRPNDGGGTVMSGPKLKPYEVHNSDWRGIMTVPAEADHQLMVGAEMMHELRAGASDKEAQVAYVRQLSRLLWTEEDQLLKDLRSFDFDGDRATVLTKRGGLLWLKVPGLAEKRPSVLKGDRVQVKPAGAEPTARRFEGRAERIEAEEVGLLFSPAFAHTYVPGTRLDVHFVLGRTPLKLFHQGVEQAKSARISTLFPERSDLIDTTSAARPLDGCNQPFNRNLNDEQRLAVQSIVWGVARCVPYVLFGPPGTGKTTTLVESVLQCTVRLPRALGTPFRILVCTPTNTAADHFCNNLVAKLSSRLDCLRLMAYSRTRGDVAFPDVLKYTNWDADTGTFEMPTLEELLKPAIVVATLTKAGSLFNTGVPRGHFDMIVVDEAGQAFEAEAMAPIGCLLGAHGQLVVGGDPKQLGPVVHHSLAKEHGLGMSYLERLMERGLYQKDDDRFSSMRGSYDARVITKLVRNYRSHEVLLELPNRLFYDDDLIPCVDPLLGNWCTKWEGLETACVPLLWHGIVGTDKREGNSPSWFNNDEAVQVVAHVKDLLAKGRHNPLKQEDIGVITPYNKQVHRITLALRSQQLMDVKVGSTEMFQGQERKVIIISTVRSSQTWVDFDAKHNLGFLDNPKRFNVAVTRAQSLLIIIGNPSVLASDYHWRELLRLCVHKGAYRGVQIPNLDDGEGGGGGDVAEMDDLADDLEELLLDDAPDGPSEQMQQEGMGMPSHD